MVRKTYPHYLLFHLHSLLKTRVFWIQRIYYQKIIKLFSNFGINAFDILGDIVLTIYGCNGQLYNGLTCFSFSVPDKISALSSTIFMPMGAIFWKELCCQYLVEADFSTLCRRIFFIFNPRQYLGTTRFQAQTISWHYWIVLVKQIFFLRYCVCGKVKLVANSPTNISSCKNWHKAEKSFSKWNDIRQK